MAVIDAMQARRPATQAVALALAFKLLCEELNVRPSRLLEVADAMERDCRYRNENTINAVRRYCHEQIKRKLP